MNSVIEFRKCWWLNYDQAPAPPSKPLTSKDPEAAICIPKPWPDLASPKNNQLLPKAEVFGN
jgi:hypothetical protein